MNGIGDGIGTGKSAYCTGVRQGNTELAISAISVVDHNFPESRKQKTNELPRRPILLVYIKH